MKSTNKIRAERNRKPPQSPISQAGVLNNLTGSWRYLRPRYEEKLSPCIAACPAGERIEAWIGLLSENKHAEALRLIKTVNPFPRVCGRVCFHPCETECNRDRYDRAIAIHTLERFVSDNANTGEHAPGRKMKPTGKSVGVIGSGPAGLTCAYHLALRGHAVTIYEAETQLGGLLRYGIPAHRLPKEILDAEIEEILELGIEARTGERVDDLERIRGAHDATFVATGLGASNRLGIPGEEGDGVFDAIDFLKRINSGAAPDIGGKAVIVGGGNAAVDSARAALRLGAAPTIVYRRSRAEMPAYRAEVEEAEREGVAIRFLTQPVEIIRDNGRVVLIDCVRNRLGEADESGRREPIPIEGSNFPIEADTVIVAVGERSDDALVDAGALSEAVSDGSTDAPSRKPADVFAGGDITSPQRTVAHAIGSGRRTAALIDRFLGGSGEDPADYLAREIAGFDDLNLEYFTTRPRIRIPMMPLSERERNFGEIQLGISAGAAAEEAGRCFHCGACVECDNCLIFCPDLSVKKDGDGNYYIDYDYCKGCGICVHECPRDAMSIDEEIRK